jgi:L-alanine-DL-glutamate epimerase-like enolase superfamily enzyme
MLDSRAIGDFDAGDFNAGGLSEMPLGRNFQRDCMVASLHTHEVGFELAAWTKQFGGTAMRSRTASRSGFRLPPSPTATHMARFHAISGIDIALCDLVGKITGLPVSNLLGGPFRARVPLYTDDQPHEFSPANMPRVC